MVKITVVTMNDGKQRTKLEAPYHPNLPKKAREIGGDFNYEFKCWYFDTRDEERVRKLAFQIYGTDGESPVDLVTVRINMDMIGDSKELWMFGRKVVSRLSRDDRARLGSGVIVVEGGFPNSGGTRNYPTLEAFLGTILEIRDVPRALAEKVVEKNPDAVKVLEEVNA